MSSIKLLIVDDEEVFCKVLSERLEREGFKVSAAHTGKEALHLIRKNFFDVAILDIALPDTNGIELLKKFKELNPELEVIMLTGHGSIDSSIEAIKLGAYDYLTKPCNITELELTLRKAVDKRNLVKKVAGLQTMISKQAQKPLLVGNSKEMANVKKMIHRVCDSDVPVLILGESGTGKDLVARLLHHNSIRKNEPYQALNSAALSPQLLESELFGHAKGAFTSAVSTKQGLVEAADGGTLFLDEIGEMDLSVQSKFLRFLETGEFRRLGENMLRTVQVRVVAATNKDLLESVKNKDFREDLYYRLNVVTITLPSLRERKEDIPLLASYFLEMKTNNTKILTDDAIKALSQYHFPGNVRELANIIERGILLSGDEKEIERCHLCLDCCNDKSATEMNMSENLTLREVEREHIQRIMGKVENNKAKAAKILGIGLRTLYRKLEEYNIN